MAQIPVNVVSPMKKAPQEDISPALNKAVDPPILIRRIKVMSFSDFNRNEYCKAPPAPEEPLVPESLDALQRGHVYKISKFEEGAKVECTLRIADEETAELLKGIPVRNPDAALAQKYGESKVHRVQAFNHSWIIPDLTYALEFQKRVEQLGGKVQSSITTPATKDELFSQGFYLLGELHEAVSAIPSYVSDFQARLSSSAQTKEVQSALFGEFQTSKKHFAEVEGMQTKLVSVRTEFLAQVQLGRIDPASPEYIEFTARCAALAELNTEYVAAKTFFAGLQLTLEENLKLIHLGKPKKTAFSLEQEVERLAELFPVFKNIRVEGQNLVFKKKKFVIRFQPDGVFVEGNPLDALNKVKRADVDDDMVGDL